MNIADDNSDDDSVEITIEHFEKILHKKRPYRNVNTKEIKYLGLIELEKVNKQSRASYLENFLEEYSSSILNMSADEFHEALYKLNTHLETTVFWEPLEDTPSLRILYGKRKK